MLHTLHLSPFSADMDALMRLIAPGDTLLLIQDGVIAALRDTQWATRLQALPAKVLVLGEDVQARGLAGQISSDIPMVSYTDFVTLALEYTHQMAW